MTPWQRHLLTNAKILHNEFVLGLSDLSRAAFRISKILSAEEGGQLFWNSKDRVRQCQWTRFPKMNIWFWHSLKIYGELEAQRNKKIQAWRELLRHRWRKRQKRLFWLWLETVCCSVMSPWTRWPHPPKRENSSPSSSSWKTPALFFSWPPSGLFCWPWAWLLTPAHWTPSSW